MSSNRRRLWSNVLAVSQCFAWNFNDIYGWCLPWWQTAAFPVHSVLTFHKTNEMKLVWFFKQWHLSSVNQCFWYVFVYKDVDLQNSCLREFEDIFCELGLATHQVTVHEMTCWSPNEASTPTHVQGNGVRVAVHCILTRLCKQHCFTWKLHSKVIENVDSLFLKKKIK